MWRRSAALFFSSAIVALNACGKNDRALLDVAAYCRRITDLDNAGQCNGVNGVTQACTNVSWAEVVPPSCNDAIASTSCSDLVNADSAFWRACNLPNACSATSVGSQICSGGAVVTSCNGAQTRSYDCRKLCAEVNLQFNDDCDDDCGRCGNGACPGLTAGRPTNGPPGYNSGGSSPEGFCCCT